ncbi:MAG: preprotein translocase subunit SecY, partial [archaeon]
FVGAQIIKIDLKDPEQRRNFQSLQKLLALILCFFEAGVYVLSGFIPANPGLELFAILQLAFGGIIIMYLDEVVSKYGIGSGVGLFIAAGVSFTIIWQSFAWVTAPGTGTYIGLVPQILQGIFSGEIPESAIFPLLFTIIVFLIVVFAESMKIEIPVTFGRIRGFGTRYPLKFFYVSNIPVILAAALFANIQLFGVVLQNFGFPILGHFVNNQAVDGIAYYLRTPYGVLSTPSHIAISLSSLNIILNIIVFSAAMIISCVMFGMFWVQIANMDAKSIAQQLQNIGLQIPGFRRDPRVIEEVLERYIPYVTILGSAAVGLLAVFADLTGALGTGTGILLTVGILYRFYEELAAEQIFETMPFLKNFAR